MTLEQKEQIISMRKNGSSYSMISAYLDMPLSTVKSFIRRAKNKINLESKRTNCCKECGKPIAQIAGRKKFCSAVVSADKSGGMLIRKLSTEKQFIHSPAFTAERSLQHMEIIIENTVPTNATSKTDSSTDMLYFAARSVAETLLKNGLFSKKEYAEIDTILLEKYPSSLGRLLSENA